jgi:CRP/FNR family transcriptional regulator, cyclic AMP receptor protein
VPTGFPSADWPIFDALSEQDRVAVLAATRRRQFARREVLCHEGDPVEVMYLIETGRVAVRVTNEQGDTVTVATFGKGAIVGEMALVGEQTERTATIVAIEPTDTWMLSRVAFNRLRVDHRSVDRFLVQLLAGHVKTLASQLLEALYVPVRHRVVRRLLELYNDQQAGPDGVPIALSITQDDLAGLVGATRPTVNQVLRSLESEHALRLYRGRIEVLDQSALRRRRG